MGTSKQPNIMQSIYDLFRLSNMLRNGNLWWRWLPVTTRQMNNEEKFRKQNLAEISKYITTQCYQHVYWQKNKILQKFHMVIKPILTKYNKFRGAQQAYF